MTKATGSVAKYVVTKVSVSDNIEEDYVLVKQVHGDNVLKVPLKMFRVFPDMNDVIHIHEFKLMGTLHYRVMSEKLKAEYNNNLVKNANNTTNVVHD